MNGWLEPKLIPIAAIDPNPAQPRRGEPAAIGELAESILAHGLLQPVVVEPADRGRHVLIAGARRLAAYRHLAATRPEAGRWEAIPAVERRTDSADRLVLALLENVARQDLAAGEILAGVCLLRDLRGWGPSEMARRLGVTRQWIQQCFRVADDPTLSRYVEDSRLSIAKAYEVRLSHTPEARQAALDTALKGAPLRLIREIARPASAPATAAHAPGVASHLAPGGGAHAGAHHPPPEPYPAPTPEPACEAPCTAAAVTRGRANASGDGPEVDPADVAQRLGLRVRLRQLQTAGLIVAAAKRHEDIVELAALIRVLRADLQSAEDKVRLAGRQTPQKPGASGPLRHRRLAVNGRRSG